MSDKKLLIKLAADVEGLKRGLRQASQQVDTFATQVQKVGSIIGVAFSVRLIGDFVSQVSRLAGEAEGVTAAFNRLPNSISLMRDLKDATGGTVSELELMKRSVMASNFEISLQSLPRLLEFATLRARQTGQSVDYLVDSIVTGIGRKSKLILDNLGISAVKLTEALGGASAASSSIAQVSNAVGKIIDEELPKMGKLTEDAAVKADRLSASWENLKVTIGKGVNAAGGSALLDEASRMLDQLQKNFEESSRSGRWLTPMITSIEDLHKEINKLNTSSSNGFFKADRADDIEYIAGAAKRLGVQLKIITDESTQGSKIIQVQKVGIREWIDASKEKEKVIRNEKFLTELLNNLREEATLSIGKERAAINLQIQALEKELKALQELGIEKDKQQRSEEERLIRIAKREREIAQLKGNNKYGVSTNSAGDMAGVQGNSFNSMRDAAEALGKQVDAANEKQKKLQEEFQQSQERISVSAARIGDSIGQAIGDMITGAETFQQVMSKMAVSVVNELERIALAKMLAAGANPFTIGLAMVGFGIMKSLFKSIGSNNSGGTSAGNKNEYYNATRTSASNYDPIHRRLGMMNLVAKVSGRDLEFVLQQQNISDSRSKTVYPR